MIDSFYIGAYWGARAESLPQVRDKVIKTLLKLSEIDEQFSNWFEGGSTRELALDKKVMLDNKTIERLCLQQVRKGELDKDGVAKMGFLFGLWTGNLDRESSNITFNVGMDSEWLTNACVLKLPFEGKARERLFQLEKAKKIITTFVEIWNPDYAVFTSNSLNTKLSGNEIGWIIFKRLIKDIPKDDRVIYEKLNDGYLFIITPILADDADSIDNLLHLRSYLS